MPLSDERWDIVRIVEGIAGSIDMRMELVVRYDYGSVLPWAKRVDDVLLITAGPDTLELTASVPVNGENLKSVAEFTVSAGGRHSFVLNYHPSHLAPVPALDANTALQECQAAWPW